MIKGFKFLGKDIVVIPNLSFKAIWLLRLLDKHTKADWCFIRNKVNWSDGQIYSLLKRLEALKLIKEDFKDWKGWAITGKGRVMLEAIYEELHF